MKTIWKTFSFFIIFLKAP